MEAKKIGEIVVPVNHNNDLLPKDFKLLQNFPNPFNSVTTIKFDIPVNSIVRLKLYNILGEEVITLVNEEKPTGSYEVEWNTKALPSGIYFYQLQAGSFVETKKMVILK